MVEAFALFGMLVCICGGLVCLFDYLVRRGR